MQDVCWIHNKYYKFGDQCPACQERDQAIKESLKQEEITEKEYEPGTRMWNVVKLLVWINLILLASIIGGAILLSQ